MIEKKKKVYENCKKTTLNKNNSKIGKLKSSVSGFYYEESVLEKRDKRIKVKIFFYDIFNLEKLT